MDTSENRQLCISSPLQQSTDVHSWNTRPLHYLWPPEIEKIQPRGSADALQTRNQHSPSARARGTPPTPKKEMNDPAKLLLGESPPAPTPARLLARQPGALGSWGHLLPLSERQLASATLRCLRNAMPHSVIVRVLQYAIIDDEPLETTLALVDRAIRNEVPVQEKGQPPTGARPCQSRWWNQYRRAVVDSLHGLAERCELQLVVAHHAAKLVDLIWLLPHSQNDSKAWTAKTLRSRAAYLCVGALRVAADAHGVEEPSLSSLEKAVPDLFAQQCRQSDARECELYVRQHIGWRVLTPTPLHFLRIYVSKRPLYPESTDVLADHHRNQPVNDEVRVERLFLYVQKWC